MKNHLEFNRDGVKKMLNERGIKNAELVKLFEKKGIKISEQGIKY